ncbi:MAG: alkaline phosphatase PhoX [Novosphingobium sp.]
MSLHAFGYSDGDVDTNGSGNPTLQRLVEERYSRRQTLFGGISAAAAAVFGSTLLAGCDGDEGTDALPVVSAGQAVSASSGRSVVLAGSASDDRGATTLAWSQTSGPAVTLSGADTAVVSFVAPSVAADTMLAFRLDATDSQGQRSSSTAIVTVRPAELGFTAVPKSLADVVSVPTGYTATVVYRLGDPIASGAGAYTNNGSDANFAQRAGDHHDGMYWFGLSASGAPDATANSRGLMAINHENITQTYLHPNGPTTTGGVRPYAEVIKEIEAHGVSIVEFSRGGTWAYVPTSTFNRRITPLTPMVINGPVRGAAFMRTAFSADGTQGRGTINNCANGFTPWSTYLTCEENWVGYFRRDASDLSARATLAPKQQTSLARYGRGSAAAGNYGWTTAAPPTTGDTAIAKFNITIDTSKPADGTGDFRHEIFHYGWVVEIDPFDPASTPRKRTALGRMNHEGAWPGRFINGVRPAWYLGDDAQNEYLYKFVSATSWATADAGSTTRLATGDRYLDAGTLYVARFNADGTGQWLPLVFGSGGLTSSNATYPFADQADVLANARLAGDVLGATRMDRPEWTAVNPSTGEMYLTLTNNSSRGTTGPAPDAPNPRAYSDPRTTGGTTGGNANGHIIRLRESGDTTEATGFTWDIYAFGAGRDLDPANINLSGLDDTNDFSSPDGLWFNRPSNAGGLVKPLLWIETDDGAYTDVTNCMLLASQPGTVGDGGTRTVVNAVGGTTITTRIGAAPGTKLRRFLVGPKECEITGIDSTPDGRTLFVNIQHPGEGGSAGTPTSNWPQSQSGTASGRPRSATIAITKDDGGVVGL